MSNTETRWGDYEVIEYYKRGEQEIKVKKINIQPNKHISYQKHYHRQETWTVINGEGVFVKDGDAWFLSQGSTVEIPQHSLHTVRAFDNGIEFIEVQIGDACIEGDIERITDDWSEVTIKHVKEEE